MGLNAFIYKKQNVHRESNEILNGAGGGGGGQETNIHSFQNQVNFKSELKDILSAKTDQMSCFVLQVRKHSRLLSA